MKSERQEGGNLLPAPPRPTRQTSALSDMVFSTESLSFTEVSVETSGKQYKHLGAERRLDSCLQPFSALGNLSNCSASSFLPVQNSYSNNNLEDVTVASQWKLSSKR